jgi:hypothetical protein
MFTRESDEARGSKRRRRAIAAALSRFEQRENRGGVVRSILILALKERYRLRAMPFVSLLQSWN